MTKLSIIHKEMLEIDILMNLLLLPESIFILQIGFVDSIQLSLSSSAFLTPVPDNSCTNYILC